MDHPFWGTLIFGNTHLAYSNTNLTCEMVGNREFFFWNFYQNEPKNLGMEKSFSFAEIHGLYDDTIMPQSDRCRK